MGRPSDRLPAGSGSGGCLWALPHWWRRTGTTGCAHAWLRGPANPAGIELTDTWLTDYLVARLPG
ncbi:MAG: hypothetical protein ACRDTF_07180 [Pseudonocardiaceae bacterium]